MEEEKQTITHSFISASGYVNMSPYCTVPRPGALGFMARAVGSKYGYVEIKNEFYEKWLKTRGSVNID